MVDTKKHGGKRAGAGAKPKPEVAKRTISARLSHEVYEYLQGKNKAYIIDNAVRFFIKTCNIK